MLTSACTIELLKLAILSATYMQVSDRDWLAQQPDTEQRLERCAEMLQAGRGEEIAFR